MSAEPITDTRDDRYMAVLTTLSRHGVRMDPGRLTALVADILRAVGVGPGRPLDPRVRCVNHPDCSGAGFADGAHSKCRSCARAESTPPWAPGEKFGHQGRVKAKNPEPGLRVCSSCGESKPLDDYVIKRQPGRKPRPTSRCRDCLNEAQRNRYLSLRKLAALNAARLEFVADDEVAGLRCLDCHAEIVAGDEVVAETGLRHLACGASA